MTVDMNMNMDVNENPNVNPNVNANVNASVRANGHAHGHAHGHANVNALFTALLICLVLLMVWYNIQVARVTWLDKRAETLQEQQEAIIEENKRIVAARELIRDPRLIREYAEQQLGYGLLGVGNIIHLEVQQ